MDTETISRLGRFADSLMERSCAQSPAWNLERLQKPDKNRWNYVDGCMLSAYLQLYAATGKEKYLKFTDSFMGELLREDGSPPALSDDDRSLDAIAPARVFFPLFDLTGKEKYRKGMDFFFSRLIEIPRTREGNFWHKISYPCQVWLDGLYMAMPFFMMYENRYDGMKNYFDIYTQFSVVRKRMRDEKTGLYYHGYDESRTAGWADKMTGCSPSFWLRAEGWLLMALVETLEVMDEQLYYEYRGLQSMMRELLDAVLVFQDSTGMFYQVVDRGMEKGNYLETSGTAMIAYSILKAVRLHLLPVRYAERAKQAFNGILNRYFMDGPLNPSLGGVCMVAGLGGPEERDGTPVYYYGEPVVQNEGKGVAPFLMAFAELLRIDEVPTEPKEGRLGL
ncbi:glycoside hydrolase family 88/105 protein [Caproicibacter fermentans]|uniref:Glycoside hydrolase family 88 protein n=1 Tax=Caproicibacter fermentans TaxID=2576756 RepID=A0A7G8T934_9FIRM|nr:glycoside hydrolase family 88 protein [Caproicibacter fermentans]QNK40125.1 glycoside hydrolase family 88 protein [Caproicibacter fermentans]